MQRNIPVARGSAASPGFFVLLFLIPSLAFADGSSDPCSGLLNIVDRPSNADSPCTVPFKQLEIEMGYQYLNLTSGAGYSQNFPEMELRLGLPFNSEVSALLPNYNVQSTSPKTGWDASSIKLKHKLTYTPVWVASVEGILTFPSGSAAFGRAGYGGNLNGILRL